MGEKLTGGCQCGAVRFALSAAPHPVTLCHCRMCQKASGGPFMAFAPVAATDFAITRGALSRYRSSDIAERGFCNLCGTPLTYRDVDRDRISVTVGSLDNPGAVTPMGQLGAETAPPWLEAALKTPNLSVADWLKQRRRTDVGAHQHPDHD